MGHLVNDPMTQRELADPIDPIEGLLQTGVAHFHVAPVPDWDGKGWRQQPEGQPNCVLQNNPNGEWITHSSGRTTTKKKGGLKNAAECYGKNEAAFTTVPPTIVTPAKCPATTNECAFVSCADLASLGLCDCEACATMVGEECATECGGGYGGKDASPQTPLVPTMPPWSETHSLVGKGACKSGAKKKQWQSLDALMRLNTQTVHECAFRCEGEGGGCIGFQFKPNVAAVPEGLWRKAKKGKPNCKLLTATKASKSMKLSEKNVVLNEITGSSGKPRKTTKPNYAMCYSKTGRQ